MTFEAIIAQAVAILQHRGRVTYLALKAQFQLDDELLDVLKEELLFSYAVVDEAGRGLVWSGAPAMPEPDGRHEAEAELRFHALLPVVMRLLQREGRATYRTLKFIFGLDDSLLAEIREELRLRKLAIDEESKVLVWVGEAPPGVSPGEVSPSQQNAGGTAMISPASPAPQSHAPATNTTTNGPPVSSEEAPVKPLSGDQITAPQPTRSAPEAERRQLTVMFCDLVGSTDLSGRLDPEDLREVVWSYQEAAAKVVDCYEGHIAQYLGDGLLVYFGWPRAHEDDAQRAVHTGLGIVEAMGALNTRLDADHNVQLAVRIGIHTGPVVVGEMGGGDRHENLALGETPNIAARLEGLAKPNTVVISPATAQLVHRSFVLEELGQYELKGVAEPMGLYAVVGPRGVDPGGQETLLAGGFDALVGRGEEIGLLLRRWEQSKEGLGQVVLLSGEAGIGKSSLVDGLRDHVRQEGLTCLAFRCSPYHANSAMYPIIEHVQRVLDWQPADTTEMKLAKLEQALADTGLVQEEAAPLLAEMLSLPLPEARYPALRLTPQQRREQTQDTLVAWLLAATQRHPILAVWEDLHWADPSTLDVLGLLIEQAPTAAMLHVLTFRPEFEPPWSPRSHLTPMVLNHLERSQVEALIRRRTGDKSLPADVVRHIVAKTDGVPLYVEELTQMLLDSELLREEADRYVLAGPLSGVAIPDTLQDALMARLDHLGAAKEVAQIGAVLGREFAYDMLDAVAPEDEGALQAKLAQLVEAELLYQRGRPPRSTYIFKHALIQEAAYASLLRRTRQHYHEQIAEVLEGRFPDLAKTQPELLAYHYTEAGLDQQAVGYWRQAGELASARSAHVEALHHLTKGMERLAALPHHLERDQRELDFQVALGPVLMTVKGIGHPEVEQTYIRARALCRQIGNTPEVFRVLWGLLEFYRAQGILQRGREVGEQLVSLAQEQNDPTQLLTAHAALGSIVYFQGEFVSARMHMEQGIALQDLQTNSFSLSQYGREPVVRCYHFMTWILWYLGYPDQALRMSRQARALAEEMAHPLSQAVTYFGAARLYQHRREAQQAYELAEAAIRISSEHDLGYWLALAPGAQGWALAEQGQYEAGIARMRQGLAAIRAVGAEVPRPAFLAFLAEIYGNMGQPEKGLSLLTEARSIMEQGEQWSYDAELYRLQGQLLLQQAEPDESEAEACFHRALTVARRQEAKSWELRAATSLARLWRSQGKPKAAYDLLAPVYAWFTEGFETGDLQDAQTLLNQLAPGDHGPPVDPGARSVV